MVEAEGQYPRLQTVRRSLALIDHLLHLDVGGATEGLAVDEGQLVERLAVFDAHRIATHHDAGGDSVEDTHCIDRVLLTYGICNASHGGRLSIIGGADPIAVVLEVVVVPLFAA